MKLSKEWLEEELGRKIDGRYTAERLTSAGIETVILNSINYKNVIVGKIVSIEKVNDKITLCKVFDGNTERNIICGAPNVKPGILVALALPGAVLPSGFEIKEKKVYNILSQGMICAEDELGLGTGHEGIIVLDDDYITGQLFIPKNYDEVFEFDITPNRGDCLSLVGIAREVEALNGLLYKKKNIEIKTIDKKAEDFIDVEIQDFNLCPRYTAGIAEKIKIEESNETIKKRLSLSGNLCINNIVDLTNYIMLWTGHPMHAFDYDKIEGKKLIVRKACPGEKILTLDKVERKLTVDDIVIADLRGPVAIAGIIGGLETSISETTQKIIIESAVFSPGYIRNSARRLGLQTDASYRFERGVDYENCLYSQKLMCHLISELYKADVYTGIIDKKTGFIPKEISVSAGKINNILGLEIPEDEIIEIITNLGFLKKERTKFIVPAFRNDVSDIADMAEEVARIHGYEKLPSTLKTINVFNIKNTSIFSFVEDNMKKYLTGLGFYEAINFNFTNMNEIKLWLDNETGTVQEKAGVNTSKQNSDDKFITLINPLNTEENIMLPYLFMGLIKTIRNNYSVGIKDLKYFEIGKVYFNEKQLYKEYKKLSFIITGDRFVPDWNNPSIKCDYFFIKGIIESIINNLGFEITFLDTEENFLNGKESADIMFEKNRLGFVGKIKEKILQHYNIDTELYICEIFLDELEKKYKMKKNIKSKSKYPIIDRDIAIIIDENFKEAEIEKIIKNNAKYLEYFKLFDYYKGAQVEKNKKSLTYKLVFRGENKTLTDLEVNEIRDKILKELFKFGASLREK